MGEEKENGAGNNKGLQPLVVRETGEGTGKGLQPLVAKEAYPPTDYLSCVSQLFGIEYSVEQAKAEAYVKTIKRVGIA